MISMIAAMGKNREIGLNGEMPWHLPNDLKFFKKTTSGHSVLMGRKTYESIGRPLPNRRNLVVTRSESFHADGVEVLHSLDDVKPLVNSEEEFFVIGGATLYEQLMPIAKRLYITSINAEFEADTYFPAIDEIEWKIVSSEKGIVDEKNKYEHTFQVFERTSN
ncbi:dihydrofolate reductase [Evansella cellulosilytica]|uniref:Dihydrofolate reductase n=1 Tax=Evansella cellulosilytica (strain ATCC 21833 / DSM 2522 / FERM P-1141 / JCM 9156 / N-4) TaxID=649639 RepID=E6U2F4_EVAC2|nr:dihydrofolate reductase [Evansella cellulosilytica]ADU31667.1 dihydrofolate reductase region [Evansella cellulosilytica DSM 2522]